MQGRAKVSRALERDMKILWMLCNPILESIGTVEEEVQKFFLTIFVIVKQSLSMRESDVWLGSLRGCTSKRPFRRRIEYIGVLGGGGGYSCAGVISHILVKSKLLDAGDVDRRVLKAVFHQ
mmetsp:Transcript_21568/g.40402  ORF Transcript_21568/g.40402 Transcript_21568/m.40402 type:complete len:121 (-) Transcript_21568:82-444(-)